MNQTMNHQQVRPQTAPEQPLAGQVSMLEACLTDLGVAQETLFHRLNASVLRPNNVAQMDGSNQKEPPPRPALCPLGERILAAQERVRNFIAQTQQAIDRLEA